MTSQRPHAQDAPSQGVLWTPEAAGSVSGPVEWVRLDYAQSKEDAERPAA